MKGIIPTEVNDCMRLMFNFPDAHSDDAAEKRFAEDKRQQIRTMVKAAFPAAPEEDLSMPLRNGDTIAMTVASGKISAELSLYLL